MYISISSYACRSTLHCQTGSLRGFGACDINADCVPTWSDCSLLDHSVLKKVRLLAALLFPGNNQKRSAKNNPQFSHSYLTTQLSPSLSSSRQEATERKDNSDGLALAIRHPTQRLIPLHCLRCICKVFSDLAFSTELSKPWREIPAECQLLRRFSA